MDRTISKLHNGLQLSGKVMTVGGVSCTVFLADDLGNVVLARGATVPTDAAAGFATGCMFIDSDGGVNVTMYVNDGTAASCDFNLGLGGTGDITAVATNSGSGLSGGASSGAATLQVVVDGATIEIATNTIRIKDGGVTRAKTVVVQAVTATVDGATTGIIAAATTHATVTSSVNTKQVTLPTPVAGYQLVIDVGANGFDLFSNSPATVAINGGTGSGAKSAIAANSTVLLIAISTTAWKAIYLDADGDVAKVTAAA